MAEINEVEDSKEDIKSKPDKKEEKKRKKAEKKEAKRQKKLEKNGGEDIDSDDNDSASGKIVLVLATIFIIVIWLGIFAILIKADVGGFGSTFLTPVLKDVPVINKILPDTGDDYATTESSSENSGYKNVDEAVARIKELEKELDEANTKSQSDAQTINDLNAQVQDLSKYKDEQDKFEEEKEKYDEEVVFSDKAPDIKEYKDYYESIDPANAEDDQIKDYAQTYSKMKPKEAAAIFDSMTDNFELVAKILNAMDTQSRGNILGKMDSNNAAKVTKIMNPTNTDSTTK